MSRCLREIYWLHLQSDWTGPVEGRKCVGDTERLEGIQPITATSGPAPVDPTALCAFCSCNWHSSLKLSSTNDTLPCYMLLHHQFETIQPLCRWRHYVPVIRPYNDCTVQKYKINTPNNTSESVWPAIIIMSCIQSRSSSGSAKRIHCTTTVRTIDTILPATDTNPTTQDMMFHCWTSGL